MLSITKIFSVTVNYILDFILDDSEIMKLSRETNLPEFINYLNNNFNQNKKKDLKGFMHLYNYESEEIKELIWQLKFNDNYRVAFIFGFGLFKEIKEIFIKKDYASDIFYLIPIPVHKKRRRERGYNQCEWICENIMKNIKSAGGINIEYKKNILIRKIYTAKQSRQKIRKDRLKATEDIYNINKSVEVHGKNFILIDDVYTTGATVKEARRTLLASGANKILILTIAH